MQRFQNCHASVCSKLSQLCFSRIVFKLIDSWESYHKNKKGETKIKRVNFFIETQCTYTDVVHKNRRRLYLTETLADLTIFVIFVSFLSNREWMKVTMIQS